MSVMYNWTVKRSGAGLVVFGLDTSLKPVKLTGITSVELRDGTIYATGPKTVWELRPHQALTRGKA